MPNLEEGKTERWRNRLWKTHGCRLNPGSNFSGVHIIKVGDILVKDCFQIVFTNMLAVDLAGVDPDV